MDERRTESPKQRIGPRRCWSLGLALLLPVASATASDSGIALLDGRFVASVEWSTPGGSGVATPVRLTDQSAYFWFFDAEIPEIFVKIVDACDPPFDRFWVFASGLTDVGVSVSVEDTVAEGGPEAAWGVDHPFGQPFGPILDTDAFDTCQFERECGLGAPSDIAATPRGDFEIEELTLFLADTPVAREADYQRVLADVAEIRAAHPGLQARFEPTFVTSDLILLFDGPTANQVRAGSYAGWDCLNTWYGMDVVDPLFDDFFVLRLAGRFRMDLLEPDYAELPGVLHTELNHRSFFPGPPMAFLCGDRSGQRFDYFFAEIDEVIRYFSSEPGSLPHLVDTAPVGDSTTPWMGRALACLERDTPR